MYFETHTCAFVIEFIHVLKLSYLKSKNFIEQEIVLEIELKVNNIKKIEKEIFSKNEK